MTCSGLAGAPKTRDVDVSVQSPRVLVADDPDIRDLDVSMPGSSALEVCAALSADTATVGMRLLLLSGASSDDVARGLAAGADAYLVKPFGVAEVVQQVRDLTGGQAP